MHLVIQLLAVVVGVGLIVFGAETFAEHLSAASARLGVTAFALAVLLAGAEPEELATTVTASLRHSPGIAYGDVIGANIAMCLVALGVGALVADLPLAGPARTYGLLGLPLGAVAAALAWGGQLSRAEGALLVGLYIAFVGSVWLIERRPPALGEAGEVAEAVEELGAGRRTPSRVGREMVLVLVGVAATIAGAVLLVDGVRGMAHVESTQTRLGLILVGFATAFELVVLAWSSARRGITEAVVAGVIGSFAYNVTMSMGAAAMARPMHLLRAPQLHGPWVAMLVCLGAVLALSLPTGKLTRATGVGLILAYPLVAGFVLA